MTDATWGWPDMAACKNLLLFSDLFVQRVNNPPKPMRVLSIGRKHGRSTLVTSTTAFRFLDEFDRHPPQTMHERVAEIIRPAMMSL